MITAPLAPQITQGWNPELTLRPFFEQNHEHQRWDSSQAEIRISTPSHHQPPADNYSTPNYKNNKIKPSVSPCMRFYQMVHDIRIEKQIHILPSPRGMIRRVMIWYFDLLPVRPLRFSHFGSPKTLYQIPVVKPCSHFTSLIHFNITLSLDSIPNPLIH